MSKLKGLGRGLDALLASSNINLTNYTENKSKDKENINNLQIQQISLTKIKPGSYQPRLKFDDKELEELAASIKANGVIQPIILRSLKTKDFYEIIAGERRWRAGRLAGLNTIPAIVKEFTDQEALAVALIENIQRQDLSIVEEGQAFQRLIAEFGLTHEALSKITGKSRSVITNTLRLLNLEPEVLEMLVNKELNMGHARAILPLNSSMQIKISQEVVKSQLTTSQVEKMVAEILHGNSAEPKISAKVQQVSQSVEMSKLQALISNKLGMSASLKPQKNGAGKLILHYDNIEEVEKLIELVRTK